MKDNKNRYEWMIALRFLSKGRGQTLLIVLGIVAYVGLIMLAVVMGGSSSRGS